MKKIISILLVLTLTGCNSGAKHRPIADKQNAKYESDLTACQKTASELDLITIKNTGVVSGATAIGTVAGGITGLIAGAASDAIVFAIFPFFPPGTGAATGLVVGATTGAGLGLITGGVLTEVNHLDKQEAIVANCMKDQGYKAV